jgi:hypothetical protein
LQTICETSTAGNRINNAQPIEGISSINDLQAQVLESLKIKKPKQDTQMTLL